MAQCPPPPKYASVSSDEGLKTGLGFKTIFLSLGHGQDSLGLDHLRSWS